jgi:exosortase
MSDSQNSGVQVSTHGDEKGVHSIGLSSISYWDLFALIMPSIALSPLLLLQSVSLWAKQHLQFFPLAIAAVAYFFWTEGIPNLPMQTRRKIAARYLAIGGILTGYVSLLLFSSWLAHLTLILLVFAWALGRFTSLTPIRITGICGLLIVTLPPPFGWDQSIVRSLQSLSTVVSNRLMDITGILHVQKGNVIDIATKSLFVEEACSGVDSQYALMAVAGTLLLVGRAGLFVSLLTIVTVPIWAILGNLLRIYTIAAGIEWIGLDLSEGIKHSLLGLTTFSLAAWAHWSSVQLLNFLSCRFLERNRPNGSAVVYPSQANGNEEVINNWRSIVFPGAMLCMTPAAFLGLLVGDYSTNAVPELGQEAISLLPVSRDLPIEFHGSRQVGFETQFRSRKELDGRHSRYWTYVGQNSKHVFSLDLPFRGWHPLWICYELSGWTTEPAKSIETDENGKPLSSPFFETRLLNQNGDQAILHFSLADANGNPYLYSLIAVEERARNRMSRSLVSVTKDFLRQIQKPNEPITFQFQLLSQSDEPATEEDIKGYREAFLDFRSRIRDRSLPAFRKLMEE